MILPASIIILTTAITARHIMATACIITHHPVAPQAIIAAQGTTVALAVIHAFTTLQAALPLTVLLPMATAIIAHLEAVYGIIPAA